MKIKQKPRVEIRDSTEIEILFTINFLISISRHFRFANKKAHFLQSELYI